MDVRCGRCGTEYEFDDALVSERGTTVKCTNCGHQFKVHPSTTGTSGPERWVVRTGSGRELVYTSLRDLQKGIAQRQVGPDDLLTRGNRPARPLGSIAELEPFFQTRLRATPGARSPSTLAGVAPPSNLADAAPPVAPPAAPAAPAPVAPPAAASASAPPPPVAPRPRSVPPPKPASAPPRPVAPIREEPEPPTLPMNARPEPSVVFPLAATEPELPTEVYTPTPSDVRESLRSYAELHTDPRYVVGPPSRRARSRWIGGVVVLGVVVLLGATVGRKFLAEYAQPAAAPSATRDARVADMLEEGNRRLADGDTDGAKEQYDKASVLAEKDPAVLAALARLEVVRADTVWLKLRLLDPEDKDLIAATHRQLGARVGKAEQQVRAALAVAPEDPVVRRAEIDVLRMSGELARAREKLGSIAENPSEPENAYVLAALDLAESVPGWSSVIDRLQTAAGGERALGRARAALVYALARAGRVADAKSELATIDARSRPHPLLAELTAFVKRFSDVADAGPAAEAEVATVDPASLPKLDTSRRTGDDDAPLAGDFRGQLERASAALARGDLTTASNLYGAVLAKQPGNTEALAGLAEVARKRKDPDQAEKLYDQVLEQNPSYLPALMGRADQKWDAGDRKGAIALYRRVLEQAGGGSSYGQRAAARIAEGEGGGAHAGGATAPAPTVAPAPEPAEPKPAEPKPAEPKPAEPKPEEPGIDTTDLPGMN